LSKVDPIGAVL